MATSGASSPGSSSSSTARRSTAWRKTVQVAINWIISKGALPIPGAKTALQLADNAGAVGWRLTDEELVALDRTSDRVTAS